MDLASVATIVATGVALLTALVAVVGVVLTYRNIRLLEQERLASNRQLLYAEQMKGISELIGILSDLYDETPVLSQYTYPYSIEDKRDILKKLSDKHSKYQSTCIIGYGYLPGDVLLTSRKFDLLLSSLIYATPDTAPYPSKNPPYTYNEIRDLLADAFYAVLETSRESLGIETLSQKMQQLLRETYHPHPYMKTTKEPFLLTSKERAQPK